MMYVVNLGDDHVNEIDHRTFHGCGSNKTGSNID